MKKLLVAAACTAVITGAHADGGNYAIDPTHTFVTFEVAALRHVHQPRAASTRRRARCSSTARRRAAASRSPSTWPRSTPASRPSTATCAARTSSTSPIPDGEVRRRQVRLRRRPGHRGRRHADPAGQDAPGDAEGQSLQLLPEPDLQARGLRRRLRDHDPAQPVGHELRPAGDGARQRAAAGAGRGHQAVRPAMRQHRGMKLSALLLALAAASAGAQPAAYVLDPAHSFVHFEVLHFGTSTTRGRFGPIAGVVTLDRAAGRGEVSLRIPTAGVDTGLPVFDARLREADLLASAEYPEAFFVARNFRFEGQAAGRGARRVHAARRQPAAEPVRARVSPAASMPAPRSAAATSRARSCAATSASPSVCRWSPTACGWWCRSRAGVFDLTQGAAIFRIGVDSPWPRVIGIPHSLGERDRGEVRSPFSLGLYRLARGRPPANSRRWMDHVRPPP